MDIVAAKWEQFKFHQFCFVNFHEKDVPWPGKPIVDKRKSTILMLHSVEQNCIVSPDEEKYSYIYIYIPRNFVFLGQRWSSN